MLTLLESNSSLAVGVVLLALALAARATARASQLRQDVGGATGLLLAHLALRGLGAVLPPAAPAALAKGVNVAWELALAFGAIRIGVSLALWAVRLRKRQTPKILRDVIDIGLYALVAVNILKGELAFDLTGLLATSAVLSLVLGLALQETLGNLFAGLSLQLERPFQVGDLVTIGPHTGVVVQVGWRSARVMTRGRKVVTLPNNLVAKEAVVNFTRGGEPIGLDHNLHLSYDVAPNEVKDAILDVLSQVPGVLPEPPAAVHCVAFEESAVRYQVRVFVADPDAIELVRDALFTRLWYRLRREGMEAPYPQRILNVRQGAEAGRPAAGARAGVDVAGLLHEVDLFAPFDAAALARLREGVVLRHFGRGETVLQEGEQGYTFYIVARGSVSVRAARSGAEVTRLERGQYFGEMSLLTGEPRSATVVAASDVLLLEMDRPLFAALFRAHPDLARQLSALLAHRRSQLRAVATAGGQVPDAVSEAHGILTRLRQIFTFGD